MTTTGWRTVPVTRSAWAFLAAVVLACGEPPAMDAVDRSAVVRDSLLPAVLVTGEPLATATLADRMAELHVPAVSVAVMEGGRITWTAAWGMADVSEARPATTATLFQAASISKPVAATVALELVEDGRLDLDADVNTYLRSWQVPANRFTSTEPVTLRRLVTHTAGLTVHGFPGYARSDLMPDAVGVLDGRGNTDPVVVDTTPGAMWRYSGGGYTVMQVMVTDVVGNEFAALMADRVLTPVGMTASTYEQPLAEARWAEAATGYRADGQPVEEGWHVYPEQAAAGLWTNPTDLATWALAILAAYDGQEGGVLSPALARQMLTPNDDGHGLGPAVDREGKWFGHGGSNEGFRCQLVMFFDGRGAVVMTNGDRGSELARQVLGTLAAAYDWPDFQPIERSVTAVDPAMLSALAGRYHVADEDFDFVVTEDGGRLYASAPGYYSEILPESETVFFARADGARLTAEREHGVVTSLTMYGMRAVRVP